VINFVYFSPEPESSPSSKAWIAGVVIPIVLVVIILVVLLYLFRSKIKCFKTEDVFAHRPDGLDYESTNDMKRQLPAPMRQESMSSSSSPDDRSRANARYGSSRSRHIG